MSDQPEKTDIARRVMAAPDFRQLPGMRFTRPDGTFPLRMVATGCYAHEGETGHSIPAATALRADDVVDLDDPATVGCLMALVREKWTAATHVHQIDTSVSDGKGGNAHAVMWALYVGPLSFWWRKEGKRAEIVAPTEIEVLVMALEVSNG